MLTPDATNLYRQYTDVLRASGRSERTIDNYLPSLKGFTHFLGERPLDRATVDDIVAYPVVAAASAAGVDPGRRPAPSRPRKPCC